MSKKSILLLGSPGSGKTVALETLPGGTILLNFDEGGWKSLDRQPLSDIDKQLILSGKKKGRSPKRLKFAETFEKWLSSGDTLQPNDILVIDYKSKTTQISIGLSTFHKTDNFLFSSKDINMLATSNPLSRGICHLAIDSLTGWQAAIHDAMITFRGPTKGGYIGADQDTYGKAIDKVVECIDTACHLPIDFILTAHLRSDKDAITGKVFEEIAIYGKQLPETIASKIDDIYLSSYDPSSQSFVWSAHPAGFIKSLRARSFDNLPQTFPANFSLLYKEGLTQPVTPK